MKNESLGSSSCNNNFLSQKLEQLHTSSKTTVLRAAGFSHEKIFELSTVPKKK